MIKDDQVKGQPQTIYTETKANIEALANRREGDIAYATDTDQVGIFDGSAWQWYAPIGGWINPGETWTYASATTFTVSGDQTAKYTKGTRIKLVQTTTKYFVVAGSSYSSPNTTVTVTGGSDYTLVNAAISNNRYSYGNPPDYPGWFNWTPTLTGFSSNPTDVSYKFRVEKTTCTLSINQDTAGTSNATTFYISLPITAKTVANMKWTSLANGFDNNAYLATPALFWIASGSGIVAVFPNMALGNWTASNGKRCRGQITYEI